MNSLQRVLGHDVSAVRDQLQRRQIMISIPRGDCVLGKEPVQNLSGLFSHVIRHCLIGEELRELGE